MAKTVNSVKREIDLGRVFQKYLKNWYLFAVAIVIALLYAREQNNYIEVNYSMEVSVLVEDKGAGSALQERGSISAAPGFLNSKLIDNQIALLKSYGQIRRIVSKLDFLVSYYSKGKYVDTEIYKESPFVVEHDTTRWSSMYKKIYIRFTSPGEYQLWSEAYGPFKNPSNRKVGELVEGKGHAFVVRWKPGVEPKEHIGKDYGFVLHDLNGLARQFLSKTNVRSERGPSMLVISSSGANKDKVRDYLNKLVEEFLISNVERKNKILTNTINFIEQQLNQLEQEMWEIEQEIEAYRRQYQFMFVQEKIGTLLKNLDTETKDAKNQRIDNAYYRYLYDYVANRQNYDDILMPASMGYNMPLYNALIGETSILIRERDALLANSTPDNPYIAYLDKQIEEKKKSLLEGLRTLIENGERRLRETEERLFELNKEFQALPVIEREYLTLERRYKILLNLVDFLRKRKSEVELQRAATVPDHEIVDAAGVKGIQNISKSPKSAIMNALIWALLLPAVFLFLLVFLNNRMMAVEDVMANTDVPIAGQVSHNTHKVIAPVLKSPTSYIAEQFRILRIKLGLDPDKGEQVVLVTSAALEDGRTFVALNLASACANTGKRTVLVTFDFRRPNLAEEMELDPSLGITMHLVHQIPLEQLIQRTQTKNLDVLLAGPIPPNPDEIIESEHALSMFKQLRKQYQYIVIDTPAIGLFGDAVLLNKYSDATLFVVRHNHTRKKEFVEAINDAQANGMKRMMIVYNDSNIRLNEREFAAYGEDSAPFSRVYLLWRKVRRIVIDFLRKI
ncbi:MAG: polysaccharide biosynthesis tyrosine autokinase [Bacteroidetes bacterium]|nr:polysaccharide biosynthesis tyrosine autokinase [Bacteroidota bacterium]